MTTTGRPVKTAPAGLRPLVLRVVLGVAGARYLLVGSALSLIPVYRHLAEQPAAGRPAK